MSTLDKKGLKKWYQDKGVANEFISRRFASPYGQVLNRRQLKFLENVIKKYSVKNALDLACGPGRSYPYLSRLNYSVFLDTSFEMLTQLKQSTDTKISNLVLGDAFNLPFENKFDLILSLRLLRHFKYEDRVKIYSEVRKALKPGGFFVFDAVNFDISYEVKKIDNALDIEIYDKLYHWDDLVCELKENGFQITYSQGVYYQYLKNRDYDRIFKKLKLYRLGQMILMTLEKREKGEPLEWMIACQK